MNATQLAKLLAVAIQNKLPVLIKGAPGVGKTDVVKQACEAAGADLILTHPVVEDPTDKKGLPGIVNGKAEFLPYGNLRKMMDAKRLTVVFLDDLGQAPAVVQAANMQLLLAREINGKAVSPHVVFIAATNRKEDKAGVTGILEPVKSRFATIVELTVDHKAWCDWAMDHHIAPQLIAFIRFRPELLLSTDKPTNDIVNRPSPRTVARVSDWIQAGVKDVETIAGAVGAGFAAEFIGFLRVWEGLPDIDDILANPSTALLPTDPAAVYATVSALMMRVDKTNAGKVVKYASRLPDEFATLCIRDCQRKCPTAVNCKEFVNWASSHPDSLV